MARAVTGENDEQQWVLEEARAVLPLGGAILNQWRMWKFHGILPEPGGWRAQPLKTLVLIDAIDLVYETYRYISQEKADLSKLNATQRAVIAWLENDP